MAEKTPQKPNEKFGFVGGNYLQEILDKDPSAITEEERDILRARISYLKQSQIKEFGLDVEEEEEQSREDELKAMPEKILKLTAKEAGVEVKRGMKNPAIIAAILEAESEAEESEEDSEDESDEEEESEE